MADEYSVAPAGPDDPEHDLPPDIRTMSACAVDVLEWVVLPRYDEATVAIRELEGYLRVMIDTVDRWEIPSENLGLLDCAATAVAEGRHCITSTPGSGLVEVKNTAQKYAHSLMTLIYVYRTLNKALPKSPTSTR